MVSLESLLEMSKKNKNKQVLRLTDTTNSPDVVLDSLKSEKAYLEQKRFSLVKGSDEYISCLNRLAKLKKKIKTFKK